MNDGFGVFVILCFVFIFLHQTGEDRKVNVRDIQNRQVELAQQKAQKEARIKAAIAKKLAIENADYDCRKRAYTEGGSGAASQTKHYFDFYLYEDKAECLESTYSADLLGEVEKGRLWLYTKNQTYTKAVVVQEYKF
ncbi:hypothetical protein JJD84_20635 [Pseudomonas fluorescens]|nr:hypothetical protein [Pseudomonas fluorescens]